MREVADTRRQPGHLRHQCFDGLDRVAMAEPIEKAPRAQESAIAGPWLKASYPA